MKVLINFGYLLYTWVYLKRLQLALIIWGFTYRTGYYGNKKIPSRTFEGIFFLL